MQEGNHMIEEAEAAGRKHLAQATRAGEEYQKITDIGFQAVNRSFSEVNKGVQAIAAEMTDYSKKTLEEVFAAWEQLLKARSFGEVVEIQTSYTRQAYDTYLTEISKFGEIYFRTTRNAAQQVGQSVTDVT